MKQIARAVIVLLGVMGVATAAPLDVGHSILVSGTIPAPALDSTQPPSVFVPPIRTATFYNPAEPVQAESAKAEPIKKPPRHPNQEGFEPAASGKRKATNHKKSNWFKRTFLGR